MSVWLWLLMSFVGAILYRIGGSDLNVPFKTKWRDLGVPLCGLVCLLVLVPNVAILAYSASLAGYFILSFGSLTTYWDKWGTDDVEWYEWSLTGFVYGIASFPIAIYQGRWIGFAIRTVILSLSVTFSNNLKYEWLVEPFRGFMFVSTLPLLVL